MEMQTCISNYCYAGIITLLRKSCKKYKINIDSVQAIWQGRENGVELDGNNSAFF